MRLIKHRLYENVYYFRNFLHKAVLICFSMLENVSGTNSNILMRFQANFIKQEQTFLKPQNKEQVICHNTRLRLLTPGHYEKAVPRSYWKLARKTQPISNPFCFTQRSMFFKDILLNCSEASQKPSSPLQDQPKPLTKDSG